jgi:hypothetical protein
MSAAASAKHENFVMSILERSTTYDRNKRANTSEFRAFLSTYGIAAA